MENLGVVIIGCGLIGQKRSGALGPAHLVACADVDLGRAQALAARNPGAMAFQSWEAAIRHPGVEVVIVSTPNRFLAEITRAAVRGKKHVLVEKPAARSVAELEDVIAEAASGGVKVRVGFNHRYHPALRKARQLLAEGSLGEMMFVRGRYGHGGRIGYEKEWRADPLQAGGGELIDQGVHLIDLARCFLGEFSEIRGFSHTYFWEMPVDDNAFLLLKTPDRRCAFLHVSCTEWKNLFSLEVYGKKAKLHVEGLGGSYGVERLAYYRMLPQMGPPETTIWEYPMGDDSWQAEFQEFLEDLRLNRPPAAGLADARAALAIVERIYAESNDDHHP
jgi:predicted dehydrogenase